MQDPLDAAQSTVVDGVEVDLHGTVYRVSLLSHGEQALVVRVEDRDTLDSWRGEFAAKYVEDITHKTGSFKKFGVFVRMLASAVLQQSDSVFVDLLTYQDLELLKAKKAAAAAAAAGASTAPPPPARALPASASSKRYMIMTYASEFDRVHYPLPLLPDEQPDPGRLKAVIASLRQQLTAVQASLPQLGVLQPHGAAFPPAAQPYSWQLASAARAKPDAALLGSRLEVAQAELERERLAHKRELRKKAHEVAELQEELARSRDVLRDLRLRIKGLEAELDAARLCRAAAAGNTTHAAAATGPVAAGRSSVRRPAAADRYSYGGSGSSSYLGGSSKFPSRPQRTLPAGSSRGSSPASSRAASPGYSRPWAQVSTPPRPPRPSSAPPKQRFDPTAYVRQQRERQVQQQACRQWGAPGTSSRGSSPARSTRSSRGDASGASTPRSMPRPAPGASRGSSPAAPGLFGRCDSAGPQRPQRPGSSSSIGSARDRLGAAYGVAAMTAGERRSSSRPGAVAPHSPAGSVAGALQPSGHAGHDGARAASPGCALQGVRDKLDAYHAKQRQQQQQPHGERHRSMPGAVLSASPAGSARASAIVTTGSARASAIVTTAYKASAAAASPPAPGAGGSGVFQDATSAVADIDQRLHALQAFLKAAKSTMGPTAAT